MTGKDIYILASSFLYEKDGEDVDSKTFSLGFLNILLQEALDVENSIRAYEERELLKSAPMLETLDEEIEYSDSITRAALPYGVAAQFFQEAMDNFQAENYRAKYISALNSARKITFEPIVDVYGGWE